MSFICVLLLYTKGIVKKSSQSKNKKSVSQSHVTGKSSIKRGFISSIARSTKRYGKQTVRDILLSKLFHTTFKFFIGLLISGVAVYGAYTYFGSSIENDVIVSKSEIVARVAKLTDTQNATPDAVVRVQDAETLKKQNEFYMDVKEGDYIVMYPKLAVIYDLRNNSIVAIKKSEK